MKYQYETSKYGDEAIQNQTLKVDRKWLNSDKLVMMIY